MSVTRVLRHSGGIIRNGVAFLFCLFDCRCHIGSARAPCKRVLLRLIRVSDGEKRKYIRWQSQTAPQYMRRSAACRVHFSILLFGGEVTERERESERKRELKKTHTMLDTDRPNRQRMFQNCTRSEEQKKNTKEQTLENNGYEGGGKGGWTKM